MPASNEGLDLDKLALVEEIDVDVLDHLDMHCKLEETMRKVGRLLLLSWTSNLSGVSHLPALPKDVKALPGHRVSEAPHFKALLLEHR